MRSRKLGEAGEVRVKKRRKRRGREEKRGRARADWLPRILAVNIFSHIRGPPVDAGLTYIPHCFDQLT